MSAQAEAEKRLRAFEDYIRSGEAKRDLGSELGMARLRRNAAELVAAMAQADGCTGDASECGCFLHRPRKTAE